MIYLKTSVGVEIREDDLLLSALQRNLAAGVFTHFIRIRNFRTREAVEVRREVDAFFKSKRLSRDNIVLGIPRSDAIIRHLDLPAEVADNLKQVVEYQVQSFEPIEEERSCYDFAVLRSPKNSKRLAVLLVMVKKAVLEGLLDRLRELGIKPVAVTCGSLGLVNLFANNRKDLDDKTYFLADLTPSGLELCTVRSGRLAYTRHSGKAEETTWKQALLAEVDLAAGKIGLGPQDTIEQIVLAGESAETAHSEFGEELQDCSLVGQIIKFEMPAELRRVLQQAASSLGLAVTGMLRRPEIRINLLPASLRITRNRWAYVPTVVLGLAVVLLAAALGFRQTVQEQILGRKLDEEIASLKPRVERVQGLRNQVEALEKRLSNVETMMRQRGMNLELLQELTTQLPADTYLTVYQNRDGVIQLSGLSTSAPDLIPKLEKSALLKDVVQRGTVFRDVQTGKDRFNFEAKLER
jgi:Tfp pilus assembly protein PilN